MINHWNGFSSSKTINWMQSQYQKNRIALKRKAQYLAISQRIMTKKKPKQKPKILSIPKRVLVFKVANLSVDVKRNVSDNRRLSICVQTIVERFENARRPNIF